MSETYYQKNRDQKLEYQRNYYYDNREDRLKYQKEYQKKNKEKMLLYLKDYRNKIKNKNINISLTENSVDKDKKLTANSIVYESSDDE